MLTSSNYKEKQQKVEVKVMKVKVNIPTSPGGCGPDTPPITHSNTPHHSLVKGLMLVFSKDKAD